MRRIWLIPVAILAVAMGFSASAGDPPWPPQPIGVPFENSIARARWEFELLHQMVRVHDRPTVKEQAMYDQIYARLVPEADPELNRDRNVDSLRVYAYMTVCRHLIRLAWEAAVRAAEGEKDGWTAVSFSRWRHTLQQFHATWQDWIGLAHPIVRANQRAGYLYYQSNFDGFEMPLFFGMLARSLVEMEPPTPDTAQEDEVLRRVRAHDAAWISGELAHLRLILTPARLEGLRTVKREPWGSIVQKVLEIYQKESAVPFGTTGAEDAESNALARVKYDQSLTYYARTVVMLGMALLWGKDVPPPK